MGSKTVLLAAHDVGPSKALAHVATALEQAGAKTIKLLLHGKDADPNEAGRLVIDANIVLLGMSSPAKNAEYELAIAEAAVRLGKPIALFADTFGAWSREWFAPLREKVSLLFVASKNEVVAAQKFFPKAKIVPSGNPIWDQYFLPASREEARAKLGVGKDDFVILIPGSKGMAMNVSLLETAADVLWRTKDKCAKVFFARHPGEPEKQWPFYDLLFADPLFMSASGGQISFLPAGVTSDEAVTGVDCVLHAGNSSVGLHALCRRIPVIDAPAALADPWLERECGGAEFTPGMNGVTLSPQTNEDVGGDILELIEDSECRLSPEFLSPREQGECAENIAKALLAAI